MEIFQYENLDKRSTIFSKLDAAAHSLSKQGSITGASSSTTFAYLSENN